MRYALILLFSLVACLAQAISCLPASGDMVVPPVREYDFAYHAGTDDYHFYGSDVWAVRFDFSAIYPSFDTSEFLVNKALLYLPQAVGSVRAELFSDAYGLPNSSLTWAEVSVTSNNLEVTFPTQVQNDTLWLVVTYTTNFANRFVAASAGGGSHSYFLNNNATVPYFQSLSNAGYNAELLFGLAGDFVLSDTDLELMEFDLGGSLAPRQTVGPEFIVYNHTDQPITDAVVNLNVYSPSPDFAFFDAIPITGPIAPRSEYVFDSSSPDYASHAFILPDQPLQIKLRATLQSPSLATDPQANNTRLIHRFSFDEEYPAFLSENFFRWENSSQITATQDQYTFPQIHRLNYLPILSDTLGSIPAQVRFNWYSFNSLPRTAINGDLRINGFSTAYGDAYSQACNQVLERKTFVTSSQYNFTHNLQMDMVEASVILRNERTLLYTAATEYNLLGSSQVFIGLFRKELFNGAERYVIDRWLEHATPVSGSLNAGETLTFDFDIALNNMPLSELTENYRIYFWLQLTGGGRIIYSEYTDLAGIVSNQDPSCPVPGLVISSNPLYTGGRMEIKTDGGQNLAGIRIYNLRGQKILELTDHNPSYSLGPEMFPASGVYLLRASVRGSGGTERIISKKINVIK
jgi:hypothetical protein